MHRPGRDADQGDGLAANRAVLALRDEAAPLPDQLASLAGQFRTAADPAVNLEQLRGAATKSS